MKSRSSSTSDLPKKIVSPTRALVLPPVFDTDKYEGLYRPTADSTCQWGCTVNLIKTLLDAVHKLREDVALPESDNASLKSQLNKLHEEVGQPQRSLSSRSGLQAGKEIADPSKAVPPRNPARIYAAVAISGPAHIASPSKEFAARGISLDAASAHQLFLLLRFLPSKKTLMVSKLSPTERSQPLMPLW
jgi:hypothetical protein